MLVAGKDPNAQEVALPELFVDEPSIWEDNRALLVDLVETWAIPRAEIDFRSAL